MRRTIIILAHALFALVLTRGIASADVEELDDESFREDVLTCELAVAHAAQCCPALAVSPMACAYRHHSSEGDCGCSDGTSYSSETTRPALNPAESDAILGASCEVLVAGGGCERLVEQLARPIEDTFSYSTCGGR